MTKLKKNQAATSISSVVRLPSSDAGIHNAIIRLNSSWIDATRQDRGKFFRRDALIILEPHTGLKTLRYAMGAAGLKGVTKDAIALDYDAVDALGISFNSPVQLQVRRASVIEVYTWFWEHPDLSVQLSIRLGVVGAVLGIMGFITGLAALL